MDLNNESTQIKCFLKRDHVCMQMKLGLVQPQTYSIGTVYFMDWSLWSHGLEWNCGVEQTTKSKQSQLILTYRRLFWI